MRAHTRLRKNGDRGALTDIRLEDATNKGRIDMAVLFNGQVYLFDFKVVELVPVGKALQQLRVGPLPTSTAPAAS